MKLEQQNAKLRFFFLGCYFISPFSSKSNFSLMSGSRWGGTEWGNVCALSFSLGPPASKTQRMESIRGWCCRKMAGIEFIVLVKLCSLILPPLQSLCYLQGPQSHQEQHCAASTGWDLRIRNNQSHYNIELILCYLLHKMMSFFMNFLEIFRTDGDIELVTFSQDWPSIEHKHIIFSWWKFQQFLFSLFSVSLLGWNHCPWKSYRTGVGRIAVNAFNLSISAFWLLFVY